jgi:hypothetical protein
MRGRKTIPIPANQDITPQTTIPKKVTPPPLCQKGKIHLKEVPHTLAPLTLRLTHYCPRDPRDTSTQLNSTLKKLPLKANNLFSDRYRHLHDRHVEDRDGIKDGI